MPLTKPWLGIVESSKSQTLLVDGAGTVIGFAAVQMALMRGTQIIAAPGRRLPGGCARQ